MVDKSNEYGYVPSSPTQAGGSNTGVFEVNDIVDLINAGQWTLQEPFVHIQTITANGDSFIEFTSIDESKYQTHLLVMKEYQQNSGSATQVFNPTSQLYESGVLQTGSVYYYTSWRMDDVNAYSEAKASLINSFPFQRGNLYNTSDIAHGYTYFYNLGNSGKMSHATFTSTVKEQNNNFRTIYGQATLTNTSTVDGIRIYCNGDFDGVFELYGLTV